MLQRKKSRTSRCQPSRRMADASSANDAPFSTVDRTILAELRQKLRAREAQFVVRGARKYHAFPAEDVPYPRSYDRHVVDMCVLSLLVLRFPPRPFARPSPRGVGAVPPRCETRLNFRLFHGPGMCGTTCGSSKLEGASPCTSSRRLPRGCESIPRPFTCSISPPLTSLLV